LALKTDCAAPGEPALKYLIEILKLNGAGRPRVLHSFTHKASSVHMVRETMKAVRESREWPAEAHGFRIMSEAGHELYAWPER
jgi:hypothetical protein